MPERRKNSMVASIRVYDPNVKIHTFCQNAIPNTSEYLCGYKGKVSDVELRVILFLFLLGRQNTESTSEFLPELYWHYRYCRKTIECSMPSYVSRNFHFCTKYDSFRALEKHTFLLIRKNYATITRAQWKLLFFCNSGNVNRAPGETPRSIRCFAFSKETKNV